MKKSQSQSVFLVVTSAIVVGGEIAPVDTLVEVTNAEARNLLHRGKARLATEEDGAPAEADDPAGDDVDLSRLTKAQLLERAAAMMIADAEKMSKAGILAALQRRQELESQQDA